MSIKEKQPKKRIQVQVDHDLANDTGQILNELGLTPTTAITMLYKRIVANGGLPFNVALTDREKATLKLLNNTKKLPVTNINTQKDLEKWFADDSKDYQNKRHN